MLHFRYILLLICIQPALTLLIKVVLLFDPAATPVEKDAKRKTESQSGPNPNGWTKPIKYRIFFLPLLEILSGQNF